MTEEPRFWKGIFLCTIRPKIAAKWRYSTTIGGWIALHPNHVGNDRILAHENVHVRQYEDLNLLGAVLGGLCCIVSWKLGLILWATSGPLWLLPNYFSGWVRYGDAYYGSNHERHAYSEIAHFYDKRD
jgi:hypothetical protein